jgi:hypothetical protein
LGSSNRCDFACYLREINALQREPLAPCAQARKVPSEVRDDAIVQAHRLEQAIAVAQTTVIG